MKLRFSLRTMLILMTCAAALCWWRDRPRRMADQFVIAIEAGNFDAAGTMFTNVADRSLFCHDTREKLSAEAVRAPQSASDWLAGKSKVRLKMSVPSDFDTGPEMGTIRGKLRFEGTIVATGFGLLSPTERWMGDLLEHMPGSPSKAASPSNNPSNPSDIAL